MKNKPISNVSDSQNTNQINSGGISKLISPAEWTGDPKKDEFHFYQIKEKLKFYEKIEIQNLLEELKNKTHLIENFIQQKKDQEAQKTAPKKVGKSFQRQSPHPKFPELRWDIPYSNVKHSRIASCAEPSSKLELEVSRLSSINEQLLQLLEKNSIAVPKEIFLTDKQKVSFALPRPPQSARSYTTNYSRPQSGQDLDSSTSFIIPDISRASSARRMVSRPDSRLSATVVGTPNNEFLSRPNTSEQKKRSSRPVSARSVRMTGFYKSASAEVGPSGRRMLSRNNDSQY